MKKFFGILIFSIFFLINVSAEERESQLNNLFDQLKKNDSSMALKSRNEDLENLVNTSFKKRANQFTGRGISFSVRRKNIIKHIISFTKVIFLDPNWPEAWNKRATLLYMMGRYQESQNDIDKVLKLEKRHFGALAGQGLVSIALEDYEKAINSYKEVEKIYPKMRITKNYDTTNPRIN